MTDKETMPLPDQSNGLVLVEDAIVCPFFIQELKEFVLDYQSIFFSLHLGKRFMY